MKKTSVFTMFYERFQNILNEMDQFETDDELEEMNAEFEDALFMMETIDMDDEDAAEELQDSLDDLQGVLEGYTDLAKQRPELKEKVTELEMALHMARSNLL